jgi:hypothetical protein
MTEIQRESALDELAGRGIRTVLRPGGDDQ